MQTGEHVGGRAEVEQQGHGQQHGRGGDEQQRGGERALEHGADRLGHAGAPLDDVATAGEDPGPATDHGDGEPARERAQQARLGRRRRGQHRREQRHDAVETGHHDRAEHDRPGVLDGRRAGRPLAEPVRDVRAEQGQPQRDDRDRGGDRAGGEVQAGRRARAASRRRRPGSHRGCRRGHRRRRRTSRPVRRPCRPAGRLPTRPRRPPPHPGPGAAAATPRRGCGWAAGCRAGRGGQSSRPMFAERDLDLGLPRRLAPGPPRVVPWRTSALTHRGDPCPAAARGRDDRSDAMVREESYDSFYRATRRRLLHQAFALTGDLPAAQSAVRDAYVGAWQHWRKVAPPRGPARLGAAPRLAARPATAHGPDLAPQQGPVRGAHPGPRRRCRSCPSRSAGCCCSSSWPVWTSPTPPASSA